MLEGGQQELDDDYLGFLKGGCSKDPLDLLKGAGVDMTSPAPIQTTLKRFETLTKELDRLIKQNQKSLLSLRESSAKHSLLSLRESNAKEGCFRGAKGDYGMSGDAGSCR